MNILCSPYRLWPVWAIFSPRLWRSLTRSWRSMTATITATFLLFFCSISLSAQSPYQLKTERELGLLGASAGMNGLSAYLHAKTMILQPEDIAQLDESKIWGIDRWVTQNFSVPAQKSSDVFLYSSFFLPFTLMADQPARRDFTKVGVMYMETLLLNFGATNLTKSAVRRPRPFMYNPSEEIPMSLKMKKSAQYSFFSGHTSFTAAMSFFTAKLHSDYYPDSNASPVIWGLAAAIPAFTGLQRIRGGKHFLTDVIVGYVVGAGIGILVPELHN